METFDLQEMEVGSKILIHFKYKNFEKEYESKIIEISKGKVFLDAIIIDGKILNLNQKDIYIKLELDSIGSKPKVWKNVSLKILQLKNNKYCYEVSPTKYGLEYSRRNTFRLSMNLKGISQLKVNTKAIDVFIDNISYSGIGISFDKKKIECSSINYNNLTGEEIHINFVDEELNYTFNVYANAIRVKEKDDKVYLGCKFSKEYKQLSQYLSLRERIDTRKKIDMDDYLLKKEIEKYKKVKKYIG